MTKVPDTFAAELIPIVGERYVLADDALAALDPGLHPGNLAGDLAVFPASTEEIARIVALCARDRVAIVPQGGLTGLSGGGAAEQGQIILGLRRMNAIERLDPLAETAIVQCGAALQTVEEAANAHGLSVGIDIGARGSATIGGMIATNAGGMEAFRNGSMRNRVLGLEAVLPSGAVLGDLTEVPKCNEGYDLKHLFCGAEGTLGIVTRAVLRLSPRLDGAISLLIACNDAASALKIMRACRSVDGLMLVHAEIMWRAYAERVAAEIGLSAILGFCKAPAYLLIDIAANGGDSDEALETLVSDSSIDGCIQDALVSKNERERRDMWRIREESLIIDTTVPHCEWFDISVPLERIDETVAGIEARISSIDPDIGVWVMGHLGDGNLHYTIGNGKPMTDARKAAVTAAVYKGLKQMGGAFSAEHGIGLDKKGSLRAYSDPEKMRLIREIKQVFDPLGIMNSGKVV